jgi:acetolactate synthase-1/3 small subunit
MSPPRDTRSVISVITENEPGVLARIAGMLSGRGYNIDSLTVAPIDASRARFTILTSGTDEVIRQIIEQLGRLVPVHRAFRFADTNEFLTRELALVKLNVRDAGRMGLNEIASLESIRSISRQDEWAIWELIGSTLQIDTFVSRLIEMADVEIVRTGTAAISTSADLEDRDQQAGAT